MIESFFDIPNKWKQVEKIFSFPLYALCSWQRTLIRIRICGEIAVYQQPPSNQNNFAKNNVQKYQHLVKKFVVKIQIFWTFIY